jgi:hypothetical protein
VAAALGTLTLNRRAVAVVALLFLAGCNGGTVDQHALTNDKKTLDSIACEGALVADGVARDRTTVFYAREQAEELHIQASNLADALASRKTVPSIERQVRQTARQAARLAGILQRLHDHPADSAVGADVKRTLEQAGDCP